MAQQGVLELLYDQSRESDITIKGYVAATLANMAKRGTCSHVVLGRGSAFCLSPSGELRMCVWGAPGLTGVRWLTPCIFGGVVAWSIDDVRPLIVQTGGVEVIVDLARCFELRVQSYAAAAIANISSKGMRLAFACMCVRSIRVDACGLGE